ncbi:NUC173-domain-containing protein [Fistulina hepatica ATCC 64428]|uniref:NUC173-domain-containing protein n=1 Tax=Fistulina hepatica ATCC 64428 TaxID=1128425 RepID=A0A0D7A125_9AGAR|nr:NUC173-domain-containing protein [Fistulina hepatica ATCC 64428]
MEEALAKIRPHTSSSLPHQKTPATLLLALESTFKDQNTEATPTAYFAALLTTLDGSLQKDPSLNEGDMLPAVLYLLALVAPHAPPAVICSNLSTILSLTSPLFPPLHEHAPPLRSQISLYHAVFQALDRSQLDSPGVRQTFASILQLCLDPRPKVRKKAAEVVKDVLAHAPPPFSRHPYAERVADWIRSSLADASSRPVFRGKGSQADTTGSDIAISIVSLLSGILPNLPSSSLANITSLLLPLPRFGHSYLTQSTYTLLANIFLLPLESDVNEVTERIPEVLKVVLASAPSKTDAILAPAWLQLVGGALLAYSAASPDVSGTGVAQVWKVVWDFIDSDVVSIRKASARSLESVCQSFTPAFILSSVKNGPSKSIVQNIVTQSAKSLDLLPYARSVPEILSVISCLISNLALRDERTGETYAETLMLPVVKQVGDLRLKKGFEFKEHADEVVSTAMRVIGPQPVLNALPLNLEPSDRQAGREPRAFLLPLLVQPHPSPLSHFVKYFVPLSERLFNLQQMAEMEGNQAQAKLWEVLIAQIWAGLPGYCAGACDLKQALTVTFSKLLSELLYQQTQLRPSILKALRVLVESNIAASNVCEPTGKEFLTPIQAQENVVFLKGLAESWLAVLFNVFGSVSPEGRGLVGEAVNAWASITDQKGISSACSKVTNLFKTNLRAAQPAGPRRDGASVTTATQDLLILLLKYVSEDDATALFSFCISAEVLGAEDNGVQKRGYKILASLVQEGKVKVDAEAVLRQLDELGDRLSPAAKKDRFTLISALVAVLPSTSLHVIPALIPEATLGTKEPSEKARNAAFELILAMGRKMRDGGVVRRSMMDDMNDDNATDAAASIEEYVTMVAGGLAGATPHMISATITALSRLVFEFSESLSNIMFDEMFVTLITSFLPSNNREVVKSVLGFVKLAVHTFPVDLIRPHLKGLVPELLKRSHDHHNHFKEKVRHIFERLLRRFSWDEVYSCASDNEASKVLLNIKKRKERAKRKKANRAEHDNEEDVPDPKAKAGDAFEDVLYGSESESKSDSDDEVQAGRLSAKSKKSKSSQYGTQLRVDDDEPMDLLQGVSMRLTSTAFFHSGNRRKPGKDAAKFKTDHSGKMIINAEDISDDDGGASAGAIDVAGSAYRETLTSVDGFRRGPNGRVKFNKDTKKRRREELMDEDVEMADATAEPIRNKKPKHKAEPPKFGHEFKAKKAGGDVKKGMDPYAYLSLAQVAKKGRGGRAKIGIAGKRS